MRRLSWLPVAFGVALAIMAGAVDRSLVRLTRDERARALAEIGPEQQRATLRVMVALRQVQEAVERGAPPAGVGGWTVQRPGEPSAGTAAAPGVDRAALASRLASRGVTPNGLPEAVVAALALGDAASISAVAEDLVEGRLPVRAEDLPVLGARLGIADDARLGELQRRLRSLPPTLRATPGWSWSLGEAGLEGWGVSGRSVHHATVDLSKLALAAGLDARTRIVPTHESGSGVLDAVAGAAVFVAPDESVIRRLRAWRIVTWASAGVALLLSVAQARLVSREARLAARERAFVANVTHELRTPLAALRALGETLVAGRGEPAAYGALVADEARRMEALVERVLAAARADERPNLADCSPADVVHAALDLVRSRAQRRDVTLAEDIAAGMPMARWDEEAVRGAVANLLENAVKHGRERGHVEVSTRLLGERVAIRVRDDGPGIARQQRQRIFRRFERGVTEAPGAGLGLALVEQVASAHGGSVEVESRPGDGCTFTLLLPLRVAA